jgi:hypothetical protein
VQHTSLGRNSDPFAFGSGSHKSWIDTIGIFTEIDKDSVWNWLRIEPEGFDAL